MCRVNKVKCYRASQLDPRTPVVTYKVFVDEQNRCLRVFSKVLYALQNDGYISAEKRRETMASAMCRLAVEDV